MVAAARERKQLYETLHVGEHQIKKERDMYTRLEQINTELLPLEQVWENHMTFYSCVYVYIIFD